MHHVACLLAYGANAIVPYLAQRTVEQLTLTEGLQGTVVDNVQDIYGCIVRRCH
ncbi:glutamate synthase central domain-containing protein [Staphylococcus aureus]|nr:glutamate synthase central domain-containing protein [Staphylococcus aureus]